MDPNLNADQFFRDGFRAQDFQTSKNDEENFNSVEYFKSLEKWVQEVVLWQHFNFVSWQSFLMNQPPISFQPSGTTQQPMNPANFGFPNYQPPTQIRGIECKLPPLWKRLLAEIIDFLCLFMVKIVATFILIDFLDIIDWNKYDFDALMQKTVNLDITAAMELSSELMLMEFAHRITVCLFESFWLHRGFRGVIGGSTPGKKLMNLRVVHCEKVTPIRTEPEMIVLVEPGTDLGIYNRTGYDLAAQSIVVEDPLRYHTSR